MLARRLKHLDIVPPAEAAERPTLRTVSPKYGEMLDKWAQLNEREAECQAELNILNPKLKKAGAYSSWNTLPQPPSPPDPGPNPAVVALLGDLTPPVAKREPLAPEWHAEKARAKALSSEMDAIREARRLLADPMRREHLAASRALCNALSGEYANIAGRICDAIVELGEAQIAQEQWLGELTKQSASIATLRPVLIGSPDESGDQIARLRRLLLWASENDWFDEARIPETWAGRN